MFFSIPCVCSTVWVLDFHEEWLGLRIAWCYSFSKDMGLEQLTVIGEAFCSMKIERNRECTNEQVSNKQKHVK